jgi:predicted transglutaminase-like cysteine proteinase
MQGRSTMSVFVRCAQTIFLVAVTCCYGASTDAHPDGFSPAIEAYGNDTPSDLVTSGNKSEYRVFPRLALLTPGQAGRSDDLTPTYAEPFGMSAMAALPSEASIKWADLQSRLLTEEKALAACRIGESACPIAARRFLSIVELGRQRQGRALLGWINRAVNLAIRPMSDWAQYGVEDYWSTPLETLSNGAGDCEDYAIVKYVALRESGIVPDNLRLVIVRDSKDQTDHAVLAVRNEEKWLILDNRTLVMVDAEQAQYYYPLFVLDHRGARTFVTAVARR